MKTAKEGGGKTSTHRRTRKKATGRKSATGAKHVNGGLTVNNRKPANGEKTISVKVPGWLHRAVEHLSETTGVTHKHLLNHAIENLIRNPDTFLESIQSDWDHIKKSLHELEEHPSTR